MVSGFSDPTMACLAKLEEHQAAVQEIEGLC